MKLTSGEKQYLRKLFTDDLNCGDDGFRSTTVVRSLERKGLAYVTYRTEKERKGGVYPAWEAMLSGAGYTLAEELSEPRS